MNKEYYLIKYNSPNCFEAYIINKDNYEYINKKINVYYEYITFEDIT